MTDSKPGANEVEETPPILGLATLAEDVPPDLADRVTSSIHRRLLAGDLIEVSWSQLIAVATELLKAVFGAFGNSTNDKRDEA